MSPSSPLFQVLNALFLPGERLILTARMPYCNDKNKAFFPSKSSMGLTVKIKLGGQTFHQVLAAKVSTMP